MPCVIVALIAKTNSLVAASTAALPCALCQSVDPCGHLSSHGVLVHCLQLPGSPPVFDAVENVSVTLAPIMCHVRDHVENLAVM